MRLLDRMRPRSLSAWPSRTVRLRLTLLYGALFLISGAVLLTITYLLVQHNGGSLVLVKTPTSGHAPQVRVTGTGNGTLEHLGAPPQFAAEAQQAQAQAAHDHASELHQLLTQSGIALVFMTVVSIALGWLVAGRVLRPLRTITQTTRHISEDNLHQRLAIEGPRDELTDLADTVNGLLERLDTAFGAQRRFVANAAHELRTPLTLLHALLEEQLTDPNATLNSFRSTSRRLLTLGQDQERLLEALLTLASSERGLDNHEPFDLSVITDEILTARLPEIHQLALHIDAKIAPAPTIGDPALAQRLVANLIDNAIHHNTTGGQIEAQTGTRAGRAFISIANTGRQIPADELERLFEPFQRLGADRTNQGPDQHGLGLSIVRAIASAHHATLTARARPQGGLAIEVSFPATPPPNGTNSAHVPRTKVIRRTAANHSDPLHEHTPTRAG